MSNIDKRADSVTRIIADLKLKHGSGDTYAPIMRWDELLSLLDELEAAEKTSAARLGAIDTIHKMFQRERDRADAAEKRVEELEAREVRLTDINRFLADVEDATLANALRLLAEGVRSADVSAIRRAGINIAAAGKGE
ncbi:hypothetical protein [Enterobacter cloacae]|uniref:hypothetical protein n=1 Tax=Enterobacter cloacae TaxID=550 RepID=UPI0006822ACA|nr:hypothetical protein [Enterobacter cloacae]